MQRGGKRASGGLLLAALLLFGMGAAASALASSHCCCPERVAQEAARPCGEEVGAGACCEPAAALPAEPQLQLQAASPLLQHAVAVTCPHSGASVALASGRHPRPSSTLLRTTVLRL